MNQYNKSMQTVLGGAIATMVVWGLDAFAGVTMPAEVGAALATIIAVLANMIGPANAPA